MTFSSLSKLNLKFLLFHFILFLTCFENIRAATYFLSNHGDDGNNGLSPVFAWQSIPKLNSVMNLIQPGDEILFERGSYFSGQINLKVSGNEGAAITFGAYGEGRNPIISGSILVNNWIELRNNIFAAESDTVLKNIFFDSKQMTLARYPNSGFLSVKKSFGEPTKGFFDNELNQTKGFWNGSNVRIRTINWAFEHSPVKNFSNGSITFLNKTHYPVLPGWGYYLDNNLNLLDTAGEWYCRESGNSKSEVFFYPPAGINPNTAFVEGSVYNFGVYSALNLNHINFRDLEFRNQTACGIYLAGAKSQIKIFNCTFRGQNLCGINFPNRTVDCLISNCRFYNINGKGINSNNSDDFRIENNIFENIGMTAGYGTTGDAFGNTAIAVSTSVSNYIGYNYINKTGHDGINCIGMNNLIERNIINNTMMLLNDGGAVKSYGANSKNSIWKNNFICNVPGSLEGASLEHNKIEAQGIYLDAFSNNIEVSQNTITKAGASAINLYDRTNDNLFKKNICYDNKFGISFLKNKDPISGNIIVDNIFFGISPDQYSVKVGTLSDLYMPGRFDSNYYCNPFSSDLFRFTILHNTADYNFSVWKKFAGNVSESHSYLLTGQEIKFQILYRNMTDDTVSVVAESGFDFHYLNQSQVYGSVTIPPWCSEILISNSGTSPVPELTAGYKKINFQNSGTPAWFNLTGSGLFTPVTIKSPPGFSISLTDDFNFSGELALYPAAGELDEIIFVRFNPEGAQLYSGFISITSGNLKSTVKTSGKSD